MEIGPDSIPPSSTYKILTGSIVPRPIGWISTVNAEGRPNLAPFSYFNAVSNNPPVVIFSPMIRKTDKRPKDTLNNLQVIGEFVVNIVTEETAEAMNITATEFPEKINEFEAAGLHAVPSVTVKPPRVGESPIHFECRVLQLMTFGSGPGGGNLVIGQVIHIHVRDDLLIGGDKIDIRKLKPVGRLAGGGYCRVTDLFEMERPPSQIKL